MSPICHPMIDNINKINTINTTNSKLVLTSNIRKYK